MSPSVPIPTDNIYKFFCLFGLALIVSSIFAFVASYSSALDRKVKYFEAIIILEAKDSRSKVEDDTLALTKRLVEITDKNLSVANSAVGVVLGLGLILSGFGARRWYARIQPRDDMLAELQIAKLQAEVAKLNAQASPSSPPCA